MVEPLKISVVIPTYQRRESVRGLLKALCDQTMPATDYEVIVSIDGSTDATREMVEEFEAPYNLQALWRPNQGRATACNTGIKAARGEILVFLDDDMEPSPGFLEAHYQAHQDEPHLGWGIIGAVPIRYDRNSPPVVRFVGEKFNRHLENLALPGREFKLRDFYSGNFSIRREILTLLNGFDEDFTLYGNEDLELSVRLKKNGITLKFSREALAYQSYNKNFAGLIRDNIAHGQTSVLLATKHPETFKDLKLSAYRQRSLQWRFVRAGLLRLSRLSKMAATGLVRFMAWFERRGLRLVSMNLYYNFVLDYCYWYGVTKSIPSSGKLSNFLESLEGGLVQVRRRVFYFTDSSNFGGAEQSLLNLMKCLDRNCWEPVLIHHPGPGIAPLVKEAQEQAIETWPVPPMPEGWQGAVRALKFAIQLRRRRPAVFHAHLTWPRSCKFGLAAAVLARVRAIVATEQLFVETSLNRSIYLQQQVLARGIDRYIAVSQEVARRLNAAFQIPLSKIKVIPNGIPVATFSRPANPTLRATFTSIPGRPIILTPARLDKQKGHIYLLKAATQVPDALFLLVGDGPERTDLETQVQQLNIADRVLFLGFRQDIPELLSICDMMVLPSLFEGLPLSILEAMAAGKPVIATNIGGTSEAVTDGVTGLLVPPADPAALAGAISRLLDNPGLASDLAEAGLKAVSREFSLEIMTKRICQLYNKILKIKGFE